MQVQRLKGKPDYKYHSPAVPALLAERPRVLILGEAKTGKTALPRLAGRGHLRSTLGANVTRLHR